MKQSLYFCFLFLLFSGCKEISGSTLVSDALSLHSPLARPTPPTNLSLEPLSYGGVWIFDFYGASSVGTTQDISMDQNLIAWANPSYRSPYANRNDVTTNLLGGVQNNRSYQDAPITAAMEANEYPFFLQKVQANGIKLRPEL